MRETSESPSRIKWVHHRAGMALNGDLGSKKGRLELTCYDGCEFPCNQLHPLLATGLNVFSAHYRVQVLKKFQSSAAAVWHGARDAISAGQRGAVVIGCRLDRNEDSPIDFFGTRSKDGSFDDLRRFRLMSQAASPP